MAFPEALLGTLRPSFWDSAGSVLTMGGTTFPDGCRKGLPVDRGRFRTGRHLVFPPRSGQITPSTSNSTGRFFTGPYFHTKKFSIHVCPVKEIRRRANGVGIARAKKSGEQPFIMSHRREQLSEWRRLGFRKGLFRSFQLPAICMRGAGRSRSSG